MTTQYDFTLRFVLTPNSIDPDTLVDALFLAGCDDATLGTGYRGRLALNFSRESKTAEKAVLSAIADVIKAIPTAQLIEVSPDFVGLTDIADLIGCSRQNIRKLALSADNRFPPPIHAGSASIWHLATVLQWLKLRNTHQIDPHLIELSAASMKLNIENQAANIPKS